ncbi:MAG TPA: hypothetical protein VFI30_01215, partial [Nocardioidaceae bacterium]|nr:hypothetical protein [Nocardioidaceae bacterium]
MTAELTLFEVDVPEQADNPRPTSNPSPLGNARGALLVPFPTSSGTQWGVGEQLVCGEAANSLLLQTDARQGLSGLLTAECSEPVAGTVKLCYLDPPY